MASDNEDVSMEIPAGSLASIAQPLAGKKLHKKLLKLVKKGIVIFILLYLSILFLAAKDKCLKRGVKEVVKAIRKNNKGLVILAGDISPIDVLSHMPVLCEDAGIPYIYVPSKAELGISAATKRATSCILVTPPKSSADYKEYYDYAIKEISA